MFQKIAKVNIKDGWAVEIGYDVPDVITNETQLDIESRIINETPDFKIDVESEEYKQAESVAEVLKIGFQIGCSYTMKVVEQVSKTGSDLVGDSGVSVSMNPVANDSTINNTIITE